MKLFSIFAIALVQANPLERADKPGIATAAFDEKTPNIGKIGCGKGTILITQVSFYSSNLIPLKSLKRQFGETKRTTHANTMSPRRQMMLVKI